MKSRRFIIRSPRHRALLLTGGSESLLTFAPPWPRSRHCRRCGSVSIAHGIANQATTVMIRARAAITMIAHSVTQIANGTRRFRCMFGQIKRREVFCTTQRQRRAHRDRAGQGCSFASSDRGCITTSILGPCFSILAALAQRLRDGVIQRDRLTDTSKRRCCARDRAG